MPFAEKLARCKRSIRKAKADMKKSFKKHYLNGKYSRCRDYRQFKNAVEDVQALWDQFEKNTAEPQLTTEAVATTISNTEKTRVLIADTKKNQHGFRQNVPSHSSSKFVKSTKAKLYFSEKLDTIDENVEQEDEAIEEDCDCDDLQSNNSDFKSFSDIPTEPVTIPKTRPIRLVYPILESPPSTAETCFDPETPLVFESEYPSVRHYLLLDGDNNRVKVLNKDLDPIVDAFRRLNPNSKNLKPPLQFSLIYGGLFDQCNTLMATSSNSAYTLVDTPTTQNDMPMVHDVPSSSSSPPPTLSESEFDSTSDRIEYEIYKWGYAVTKKTTLRKFKNERARTPPLSSSSELKSPICDNSSEFDRVPRIDGCENFNDAGDTRAIHKAWLEYLAANPQPQDLDQKSQELDPNFILPPPQTSSSKYSDDESHETPTLPSLTSTNAISCSQNITSTPPTYENSTAKFTNPTSSSLGPQTFNKSSDPKKLFSGNEHIINYIQPMPQSLVSQPQSSSTTNLLKVEDSLEKDEMKTVGITSNVLPSQIYHGFRKLESKEISGPIRISHSGVTDPEYDASTHKMKLTKTDMCVSLSNSSSSDPEVSSCDSLLSTKDLNTSCNFAKGAKYYPTTSHLNGIQPLRRVKFKNTPCKDANAKYTSKEDERNTRCKHSKTSGLRKRFIADKPTGVQDRWCERSVGIVRFELAELNQHDGAISDVIFYPEVLECIYDARLPLEYVGRNEIPSAMRLNNGIPTKSILKRPTKKFRFDDVEPTWQTAGFYMDKFTSSLQLFGSRKS